MEVFVAEAGELALRRACAEGEGLHAVVVEGAYGVDVGAGGQLVELLLSVVKIEDLLDAVEVLTHVVLMHADSQSLVDLPLHLTL